MDYICKCCKYETNYKRNYERHLQSKKHICISTTQLNYTKNNVEYICVYCKRIFLHSNNLSKHLKYCTIKKQQEQNSNSEQKLKILAEELKLYKQENIYYKKELAHYERETEYYKMLLNSAGGMLKKSISSLSYIVNNFKNAPVIETIDTKNINANDFKNNEKLVKNIIYHNKQKILHEYLGGFIVDIYKKEDPSEQSIWSTDHTRLNYLLKELIDDDSSDWIIDKAGIKAKKYLINPLLAYIKPLLSKFIKKNAGMMKKMKTDKYEETLDNIKIASEIIEKIDNNGLADDILKYIAPYLRLNNNLLIKE